MMPYERFVKGQKREGGALALFILTFAWPPRPLFELPFLDGQVDPQ